MATAAAAAASLRRFTDAFTDVVLFVSLCAVWVCCACNVVSIAARWAGAGEVPAVRDAGGHAALVFVALLPSSVLLLLARMGRVEAERAGGCYAPAPKLYRRNHHIVVLAKLSYAFGWVAIVGEMVKLSPSVKPYHGVGSVLSDVGFFGTSTISCLFGVPYLFLNLRTPACEWGHRGGLTQELPKC